jgi:hypothetical protein
VKEGEMTNTKTARVFLGVVVVIAAIVLVPYSHEGNTAWRTRSNPPTYHDDRWVGGYRPYSKNDGIYVVQILVSLGLALVLVTTGHQKA